MLALPFRPPARFTLAVDARLAEAPLGNEHIWSLHAAHGLQGALAAVTTYGLRVQEMAVFPFVESSEQERWATTTFAAPPKILALAPGYAKLACAPFPGLELTCRYWVAHPHALLGQLSIANNAATSQQGNLGVGALLRPLPGEEGGMATQTRGAIHYLQGEAGGLLPILFLTGGAEGVLSPFPALKVTFNLPPGGKRTLTWVVTALTDADAGFDLARQLAARSWEAFLARLNMTEAQQPALDLPENPALSWAFRRARQTAMRLLQRHPDLPHPFFVTAREPDHGSSADPLALNRAPSVLEACHLAGYFLPANPQPVQHWVANFFARQEDDGFIPWKPSQTGGRYLASPLLAELTYRAWAHAPSGWAAYAEPLHRFVEAWYARGDANRDGFPEWQHPLQMGLPDLPAFAPWQSESVGSDLAKAESPALYALLYRALERTEEAFQAAGMEPPPDARSRRRRLRTAVQAMWDARRRAPLYRDYETHERPPHRTLSKLRGSGVFPLGEALEPAGRVVVHVFPAGGGVRRVTLTLRGSDARGKPLEETITPAKLRWHEGRGVATTEGVFSHLAEIAVEGLRSRCRVVVLTPEYAAPDISLVLPFWAGMLTEEQNEAMRRELTSERAYARPFGMPLSPRGGRKAADWLRAVYMPWVAFAVEGLLAHGFTAEAAQALLAAARGAQNVLAAEGGFRETHHADTGAGMGGQENLTSLLPLGLWLQTAGIQPLSPRRFRFNWPSPFPEPIEVSLWHWRIRRTPTETIVTTPDGTTRTLNITQPFEVEV